MKPRQPSLCSVALERRRHMLKTFGANSDRCEARLRDEGILPIAKTSHQRVRFFSALYQGLKPHHGGDLSSEAGERFFLLH